MSQQPHDVGYMDYGAPPNRSPSTSRQPYGAPGFGAGAGLSLPRQSQRPFDAPIGSAGLYSNDRNAGSYNPRGMDNSMQQSNAMQGYMLESNQPWNYNSSGAATVNGALNGPGRQRSVNRRAALPQTWTDHNGMGMHGGHHFPGPMNNGAMGNGGLRVDHSQHASPTDLRSSASDAEQLIPTAIVIKNIPFAVRKEQLASLMLDMQLPQPYAFNYHFDNGVFRGLAFANFQSAEDTRTVIEAMNGLDVQNRKLRVEYKKMLPEAERERIEREKRERRGQLEEQHRAPMLHQQSSIQSLSALSQAQARAPPPQAMPGDIDLNDPTTLEFYTELVMFRRDESREALIFPPGLAPENRRMIHILAHHMGLEHQSRGEADSRQITVLKRQQPSPTSNIHNPPLNSLDVQKRGLSRAATFDFTADRDSRAASINQAHLLTRQHPTLELPGSPEANGIPNNLRAAKSFADLRSFTPSPSQASSSYLAPGPGMNNMPPGPNGRFGDYMTAGGPPSHPGTSGTPKNDGSMINSFGKLNLGPYESSMQPPQPRSTPGAIGSQRPGANGPKGAPERQPRGPEWEGSTGFGGRGRVNGHISRGSADSSDSGARVGTSSTTASRYH